MISIYKISVIVPLFNAEAYVERCISSIRNQTYKNLEIILVNDGSTDGTLKICKEFQKLDSRIIVYNKENEGAAIARNYGLDRCTGSFIGFVDSDDYLDKFMYEKMLKNLIEFKADYVECGYNIVDKQKTKKTITYDDEIIRGNYNITLSAILQKKTFPAVWNKLFKRELFKDIRFPNYGYGEDNFIVVMYSFLSHKKSNISYSGYYYFYNERGMVNRDFSYHKLDDIKSNEELFDIFSSNSSDKRLISYIAFKIILKVIYFYNILILDNNIEHEYIFEELNDIFNKYIKIVPKQLIKLNTSRKTYLAINLFEFSSSIYMYLFKYYTIFINFFDMRRREIKET